MPLGDGVEKNRGAIAYVSRAYEATVRRIMAAPDGKRNDVINADVYSLGQILHAGSLDLSAVRKGLVDAACATGLSKKEAEFHVDHALREGSTNPRVIADRKAGDAPVRRDPERERMVASRLSAGKVEETPEQRIAAANEIWSSEKCEPVLHTPAWHYLRDTRGLPVGSINFETARYHPEVVIKEGMKPRPSLLLPCRDQHQKIVGIQIILLHHDRKSGRWIRTFKISRGTPRGNPVLFPGRAGSTLRLACEGPEDGLSLRMATGGAVMAALSRNNIRSLPLDHDEEVVVFLDRSKKNPDSDEDAIAEAARELDILCDRGVIVWTALPPPGSKDANECFIRHGADVLAECVQAMRRYTPTPKPPTNEGGAAGHGAAGAATAPAAPRQGAASGRRLTGPAQGAGREVGAPAGATAPAARDDGWSPNDPGDWADDVFNSNPKGPDGSPPLRDQDRQDARPPGNGWKGFLLRSATTFAIKSILHNAALALEHDPKLQGLVAYDEFGDRLVRNFPVPKPDGGGGRSNQPHEPEPWADHDTAALTRYLQENLEGAGFSTLVVYEAVIDVAHRRSFHPVREYLDSLKWDGKPRISKWLSFYLGAEPKAGETAKAEAALLEKFGRGFLISAVARIYQPGCQVDTMLILEGPQGNRKNSSQIALFSPWFNETGVGDLANKDAAIALQGSWCVAFDELDSMRRADVRTLKSFLTRRRDKYRPPYGRSMVERPRQCVFAGTTNEETYLRDTTGARRFWPVHTGTVDLDALTRDRDQLWAEAVVAYRSGEPWHITDDKVLSEIHERRREADPWEEAVASELKKIRESEFNASVTVRQILVGIGIDTRSQDQIASKRVVDILRHLGWRRSDQRSMRGYEWLPPLPKTAEEQESEDE